MSGPLVRRALRAPRPREAAPAQVKPATATPGEATWSTGRIVGVIVAIAVVILAGFLGPWGPHMIDLDVYRVGAHAVLTGQDIYAITDPATGLPFTYPVFAAVLFIPLALLPTLAARAVVTLLSLAALLLIVHLVVRAVRPRPDRELLAISGPLALVAVSSHPVLDTLIFGQINLVLVALVMIDVLVLRGRWKGVLVGIATGVKLTPGIFILYYLVTGQWKAARTSILTTLATVAIGFLAQPGSAWAFFTFHMFNPGRTGNVVYAGNQSLLAITARLLREPTAPALLTLSLAGAVVVVALVIARRLHQRDATVAALSVVAVAALLASPISWTHHWVWFIPCLAVLTVWARDASTAAGPTVGWWRGNWRWVVIGVATLVIWSGPMRFTPKNDLLELTHNLPQQIVANSFGILAVAFLAWAASQAWRTNSQDRNNVDHLVASGGP